MEHYQTTIVYNAQFQREGGRNEAKPRWQKPLTTMAKNLVDRATRPTERCGAFDSVVGVGNPRLPFEDQSLAGRESNPDEERRDKLAALLYSGQGQNRTGDTRLFRPLLYRLSYLSENF